ncbi:hypothetical protein V1281_001789 [Nitrobacteraceae bacterium AZCC 2161]
MPVAASYDPETIALMRDVFQKVVAKVPEQHRTSSNQAAIASRILAVAAEGRRSEAILTAEALNEVKMIFTGPQSMKRIEDLMKVFG